MQITIFILFCNVGPIQAGNCLPEGRELSNKPLNKDPFSMRKAKLFGVENETAIRELKANIKRIALNGQPVYPRENKE